MTKQIYLNILQKTTSKSRGWGFADNQHPHPLLLDIFYIQKIIPESSSYFYLNRSKDLTISSSCIIPLKAK